MIHQTAKDFLLDIDIKSDFMVHERLGHTRLAKICFNYLNDKGMRAPFARKLALSTDPQDRNAFAHYASTSWHQHLIYVSSTDDDMLEMLVKFLSSSKVLVWIESLASYSELNLLIQAAKVLKTYLQRRSRHTAPLGTDTALIDAWSNDLVRLVTKFGKKLLTSPSSIYHLIPPFCPLDTSLRKQFGSSSRGITIHGLSASAWDDCLSSIVEPKEHFLALATSKTEFAIGMSSGRIIVHDQMTCQRIQELTHQEPVRALKFGPSGRFLVSAGSKCLRLWDWTVGGQIWEVNIPQQCLLVEFADEEQLLLGAFQNNQILIWDLTTKTLRGSSNWAEDPEIKRSHAFRCPFFAALSPELNLMAVIYKGLDICIWDLEQDAIYQKYSKTMNLPGGQSTRIRNPGASCAVFCNDPNTSLLAALYLDGDLVLFDTCKNMVKKTILANAHALACSPDGRTLASGDSAGLIHLYEFETLKPLYRISSESSSITELAFSGNGHYILGIRASHCYVWDPPVLVRNNLDKENSDTISMSTTQ